MFFRHLDLTTALRPDLSTDETLLFVQDNVGLYDGKQKIPDFQNGHVYLTSHRVCYIDKVEPRKRSLAIHLKDVDRSDFYAGFLKSSAKVTLYSKLQLRTSAAPTTQLAKLALHIGGGPDSGSDSGDATPASSFPNRPRPREVVSATWICPICSFSNPVPSNFDPMVANSNTVLPPCQSCGVNPPLMVVVKAALASMSGRNQLAMMSNPTPSLTPDSGRMALDLKGGRPCPRCTFINHPSILECEMCHFTFAGGKQQPSRFKGMDSVPEYVKLSFRAGGEKIFSERLKGALIQRKWLLESAPPIAQPSSSTDRNVTYGDDGKPLANRSRAVGVASLERRGKELRLSNERVITSSFEDLDALMASAKEIIALAESFSTHATANNSAADSALASQSATALGLVTSTTKDMVGSNSASLYLSELSRNLAEFLTDDSRGVMKQEGGIMTLVDLWAVYNRARGGVELVSPADFAQAAELWEELGLPVRLRRFRRTGLLVVQSAGRTDEKTMKAILGWLHGLHTEPPPVSSSSSSVRGIVPQAVNLDPGPDSSAVPWDWQMFGRGVTVQEVADQFGWSVGVATEELEMAEENGVLCREQAVDGIRFWENWLVRLEG